MRKLLGVYRVHLLRGICAEVYAGSTVQVDIVCVDEFNSPKLVHATTTAPHNKYIACLNSVDKSGSEFIEECSFIYSAVSQSTVTRLSFRIPSRGSKQLYRLVLKAANLPTEILVLPLETGCFKVTEVGIAGNSTYISRLLCSYRSVACGLTTVQIKEEYGATIGSHVYDSSIVMLRYIEELYSLPNESTAAAQERPHLILELGAGCGPFGISLAAYLSQRCCKETPPTHECISFNASQYVIWLTDKVSQLSLLSENVRLNSHTINSSVVALNCAALDWTSAADIAKQRTALNNAAPDLIVAGDIFYDRELAALFLQTVRQLSTPGVTVILVAQKLRENAQGEAVALISEEEINHDYSSFCSVQLVREEASVRLWCMAVQ